MLLCCGLCEADIYKYQKDGVWYYTDTPPKELPPDSETMIEIARQVPAQGSDGEPLLADFPAGNAIEHAATATVAVKSTLGYGSGFFISSQGHIITNKHVVRATAAQSQKMKTISIPSKTGSPSWTRSSPTNGTAWRNIATGSIA